MASETENMNIQASHEDREIRNRVIDLKPLEGQEKETLEAILKSAVSGTKLGTKNVEPIPYP